MRAGEPAAGTADSPAERPAKNTVCLWYDGDAEAAALFHVATFLDSAMGAVHRVPADDPAGRAGDVPTTC